jgi:SagB-type dehydrogenase family enzyme
MEFDGSHDPRGQSVQRNPHELRRTTRWTRREIIRLLGIGVAMPRAAFAGAPSVAEIKLPKPKSEGRLSVEKALAARRSVREYRSGQLALADVAQILWAAQGITHGSGLRTAPSAGALYPLEVYLVAGDVAGLRSGVYRYDPRAHRLLASAEGDKRAALSRAALAQDFIAEAAAVLVFCGVYERTNGKYGERGVRYVHMEAGHAAQNVYLQAVSLGLATVVVGAFEDARVRRVVGASGGEAPLYVMPIGNV